MGTIERVLAGTTVLVVLVVMVVYATAESTRGILVGEDRFLEWTTVTFEVVAALVAGLALRARAAGPFRSAPALIVAGLAIVAALDEVSFGARILDFEPPVVEGASLDAVHDLVLITALFVYHQDSVIAAALIVLALVALGLGVVAWAWRSGLAADLLRFRSMRFLLAGFGVAAVTTVIDLDQVAIPAMQLWEESMEVGGALLILFAALAAGDDGRRFAPVGAATAADRAPAPVTAPEVTPAVTAPTGAH